MLLVAVLGVVGCTPPEFQFPAPYHCDVPVFGAVRFQYEPDCEAVQHNFALSREILMNRTNPQSGDVFVEDEKQYRELFEELPVRVAEREVLKYRSDGSEVGGSYWSYAGIALERHMWSLLHELFHHIDMQAYRFDTKDHEDWDRRGYDAAIKEYELSYKTPYQAGANP